MKFDFLVFGDFMVWVNCNWSHTLNDDTKILTETDTETFFTIPNVPKPKPRLFSETKFFRNRNRYFSSETKFFETETETFFRDQIFRNENRYFFSETKFFETETETLKNLAKVSRPRPKPRHLLKLNSENLGLTSKIGIFWDQNLGL